MKIPEGKHMSNFVCLLFFFFFKKKTAYESCSSDRSSDVCSSELGFPQQALSVITKRQNTQVTKTDSQKQARKQRHTHTHTHTHTDKHTNKQTNTLTGPIISELQNSWKTSLTWNSVNLFKHILVPVLRLLRVLKHKDSKIILRKKLETPAWTKSQSN